MMFTKSIFSPSFPLSLLVLDLQISGAGLMNFVVASHLSRQKIRNIYLKFSQPASSPCIFSADTTGGARSPFEEEAEYENQDSVARCIAETKKALRWP